VTVGSLVNGMNASEEFVASIFKSSQPEKRSAVSQSAKGLFYLPGEPEYLILIFLHIDNSVSFFLYNFLLSFLKLFYFPRVSFAFSLFSPSCSIFSSCIVQLEVKCLFDAPYCAVLLLLKLLNVIWDVSITWAR
jgi:hypothetical protein